MRHQSCLGSLPTLHELTDLRSLNYFHSFFLFGQNEDLGDLHEGWVGIGI
jgi:hypothetical protein